MNRSAALVFLGVDERSAPESEKSLPVSKPTESSTLESHSPHGTPHWAFDVSSLADFKSALLKKHDMSKFTDIRSEMQNLAAEPASIAGEGRALLDWNRRNLFCPACSRPLRSVWAGWKRACVPGEPAGEGADATPACISKKGVHNFSYPRTVSIRRSNAHGPITSTHSTYDHTGSRRDHGRHDP